MDTFNLVIFGQLEGIDQAAQAAKAGVAVGVAVMGIVALVISLVVLAGVWKMFGKAGKPGWACIVPIYNLILLLEIAGKPIWWFLLCLIPLVNVIVIIIIYMAVAEKFGKGAGFGIGLVLLPFIFFPMLGFGSAQYQAGGDE